MRLTISRRIMDRFAVRGALRWFSGRSTVMVNAATVTSFVTLRHDPCRNDFHLCRSFSALPVQVFRQLAEQIPHGRAIQPAALWTRIVIF